MRIGAPTSLGQALDNREYQDTHSVSAPSASGPTAAAPEITAPHTPKAAARYFPRNTVYSWKAWKA